jgi:hypothetical protein
VEVAFVAMPADLACFLALQTLYAGQEWSPMARQTHVEAVQVET